MKQLMDKGLLDAFLHLFFPNICVCCQSEVPPQGHPLCVHCRHRLPETDYFNHAENGFTDRFWGRIPLVGGAAAYYFRKGSRIQELMHAFKYQNRPDIGQFMGEQIGLEVKGNPNFEGLDLILPVPLHPKKQRKRGYNQSAAFGAGLSAQLGIPCISSALTRAVHTASQTKKDRFERIRNMQNTFVVRQPKRLEHKHILLVDDVLTTGATLEACALALLEAVEVRISMLTIAIAE